MYATCLFCTRDLGRNDALEHFPVGRRLAWDAAKGRLWVVCAHCAGWNLTPLEQRWEAMEEAERLYRDARQRVATDNIGLARLPDGTELVRIGRPQRLEMAAWRYGDRFGARRRRQLVAAGAGLVASAGALAVAPAGFIGGLLVGLVWPATMIGVLGATTGMARASVFGRRWVPDGAGQHLLVTSNELQLMRLVSTGGDGFGVKLGYRRRSATEEGRLSDVVNLPTEREVVLTGPAALEAARRLLPLVNGTGAPARRVQGAVAALEELGGPDAAFARAASRVREWGARQTFGDTGAFLFLPPAVRLALEMAAHEEQERRALEGELAELEAAWRAAEEIAGIADGLLQPTWIEEKLGRLKGGGAKQ